MERITKMQTIHEVLGADKNTENELKALERDLKQWRENWKQGKINEPEEVFKSVEQGLIEAIEWVRGENNVKARVHYIEVPDVNVSDIRKRTGLSQAAFARSIKISKSTLVNWEQNRRTPQGPARVLLALIDKDPEIVLRNLDKQ